MSSPLKNKKILMLSYTSFIQKFYRTLPLQIKNISGAEVKIIVPTYWKELWGTKKNYLEKIENDILDIYEGKILFTGNLHFAFFRNTLISILKSFQPDIVDLENEPFNIGSFQIVAYRNMFSKDSKIILHASQHQFKKYPFPFNLMEKYVLKNVDAILARNSMAKDVLIKKKYAKIIEIVTHGVDISAFKPREKSELCHKFNAQNKPVIGYVGTLSEHKGLKYLFRAAKDIDCKILLIGDGSEKQSLLNLSKELKLDVVFLPSLKHAEVANYMNCMDIFVLPSLTMPNWVEKFGRVLIEAMASGLPVIGSDSGEIPNVLGDAGLIFKEKDISDLRDKIQLLLNNIDLRNTLIDKGIKRVNELYSWKTIAEQTIDVYNRVLSINNSN